VSVSVFGFIGDAATSDVDDDIVIGEVNVLMGDAVVVIVVVGVMVGGIGNINACANTCSGVIPSFSNMGPNDRVDARCWNS
jgi:hypothetical protein